jgi:hypothetical protein
MTARISLEVRVLEPLRRRPAGWTEAMIQKGYMTGTITVV